MNFSRRRQRRQAELLKQRENGWNRGLNQAVWHSRKPEYDALYDTNMRHFFENERLQGHLYSMGLIDKSGRVVDLSKNKAKLSVVEHEFALAERNEYWRQREEEDMRERVQKKRIEALERAKREEKILRIREDCKIRTEIVSALRHQSAPRSATQPSRSGSKMGQSRQNSRVLSASSQNHVMEGSSNNFENHLP